MIHSLVEQIKQKEGETKRITSELYTVQNNLHQRVQSDKISDEELNHLKRAVQAKVGEYKLLLNDKSALFEEMYSEALLMINRDQQIIKNQEEIVELKHEIDINILEIEQKSIIVKELQDILQDRKEQYKKLKEEIKEIEEQCDELQVILKQKEDELETLLDVLKDKEIQIEGLEKALGEKAPILGDGDRARKRGDGNHYQALKGDIVDELLAKYINSMEIQVPVRRMGNGYYLFGTRKIFAKVMNSRLVVRVGGGYMSFTEFADTYAIVELNKILKL